MSALDRFTQAQDDSEWGYSSALAEIRAGRKTGHWIWYVFPQLAGLGTSAPSRLYGVAGRAEAEAYLHDPVLHARLLEMTQAVAEQLRRGVSLDVLMGSAIDATKLVSSLTLFGSVATALAATDKEPGHARLADVAAEVLDRAAATGYPPCRYTLERLKERQHDTT
jgi:uncharacterized protein (DUF1810 family)